MASEAARPRKESSDDDDNDDGHGGGDVVSPAPRPRKERRAPTLAPGMKLCIWDKARARVVPPVTAAVPTAVPCARRCSRSGREQFTRAWRS